FAGVVAVVANRTVPPLGVRAEVLTVNGMAVGRLTIPSPGGFVEGVTLQNLLVTEPRPRNPLLADALKRIGLAERTGRGIDLIFQGLLRYGRPAPDYSRSTTHAVVVMLPGGAADVGLLRTIIGEEKRL